MVEESQLPAKQTLEGLDVSRSSFYDWYWRYKHQGYDGLARRKPQWPFFWIDVSGLLRAFCFVEVRERTFDSVCPVWLEGEGKCVCSLSSQSVMEIAEHNLQTLRAMRGKNADGNA